MGEGGECTRDMPKEGRIGEGGRRIRRRKKRRKRRRRRRMIRKRRMIRSGRKEKGKERVFPAG